MPGNVSEFPSFGLDFAYLIGYLFLFSQWEVDEMIILRPNQERYGGLVEASPLPVPLFD